MDHEVFDWKLLERVLLYLTAIVFLIIFGFPIYWMFISSIQPINEIFSYPPDLWPAAFTIDNYVRLIENTNYLTWLKNSVIITLGNIVLSTTLATFAGYSLTRYAIPFKKTLARSLLLAYMFPPLMLGIPYFILFLELGLISTYPGLIIAHASLTLPFSTWLMWQFFQTIPIEREEAAWICGASRFRSLMEIALPSALPGVIAVTIFAFAISWGDYTFALIIAQDKSTTPLTLGISTFIQGTEIFWGILMTGATLLVVPPLILVFFLNKYILEGFSVGGFE